MGSWLYGKTTTLAILYFTRYTLLYCLYFTILDILYCLYFTILAILYYTRYLQYTRYMAPTQEMAFKSVGGSWHAIQSYGGWIFLKQQVGVQNKTQIFGSTVGVAVPSSGMFIFYVCNCQE